MPAQGQQALVIDLDSQIFRRPLHQKKEPLRRLLETEKSTQMTTTAQTTMISITPPGFVNCSEEASGLHGATTVKRSACPNEASLLRGTYRPLYSARP